MASNGNPSQHTIIDPNRGHQSSATTLPASSDAPSKSLFARLSDGLNRRSSSLGFEPTALTYEVGIRPSFYWLDADLTPAERKQQEEMARSLKSDCQDQALVMEDFGGRRGAVFAGMQILSGDMRSAILRRCRCI